MTTESIKAPRQSKDLYRVLVVDDEPIICELLSEVLRGPSRSVETRDTPRAALEFLEHNPVDLAFLDVVMPGMSGIELAKLIKDKSPQTHIIICTGYYGQEVCEQAQAVQAERVLQKPINFGDLLQIADSYSTH